MTISKNKSLDEFAIIILNWNGLTLLQKYVPSLVKNSADAKLYLIDNASTDASVSWLQKHYPQFTLIQNEQNFGFASGYNQGLKQISEPFWVLLNSDVEVTENWLVPFQNLFDHHPKIAVIQPKILDHQKKNRFEYAGAGGGFIDAFGYPYCRGRILQKIEFDLGQYNDTREIHWASGACMVIRKEIFIEQNGFDDDFFAHQEEIDLCWRIRNSGNIIFYAGNSTVYHLGGGTLHKNSPQKTYLNFRNNLCMLVKNLPKSQLITVIFIRLILDGMVGVLFLAQGKISHFFAIIRAHFAFYVLISNMYKKRKKSTLKKYYLHKSMILQLFLNNGMFFEKDN